MNKLLTTDQEQLIYLRKLSDDLIEDYLKTIFRIFGEGKDFTFFRTLCYGFVDENPEYGNMEPVRELWGLIESYALIDSQKYVSSILDSADVFMPQAITTLGLLLTGILQDTDLSTILEDLLERERKHPNYLILIDALQLRVRDGSIEAKRFLDKLNYV